MHFERNQLFRISLGISPLIQAHPNGCQPRTGSGPPFCFRRTSPWLGLDQCASDRDPVTPGAFTPRAIPITGLCAFRFRYGYLLEAVNLATETHSLPHFSKRMLRHCKPALVQTAHAVFLQAGTFRAAADYLHYGFKLFSPCLRSTFQLYVTILLDYRTPDMFRVTG